MVFVPTGRSSFCVVIPVLPVFALIFWPFGSVMVIGAFSIGVFVTGSIVCIVIVVLSSVSFNVFICSCDNLPVTSTFSSMVFDVLYMSLPV